jgi:hypothetical protein
VCAVESLFVHFTVVPAVIFKVWGEKVKFAIATASPATTVEDAACEELYLEQPMRIELNIAVNNMTAANFVKVCLFIFLLSF